MAAAAAVSSSLTKFTAPANTAVAIKFARSGEEATAEDGWFHPEFTHQVFGESETVVGFANLSVKLLYSPGLLNLHLSIKHSGQIDPKENVKVDDIPTLLGEWIPPTWTTNIDTFVRDLDKEKNFTPPGTLAHRFSLKERHFEVYLCQGNTPGFKEYLERLQPFLVWFIEAASYLDLEDERWRVFLLFERIESSGVSTYAAAGLLSVCEHYAYREHIRPRISQVLVLPPFQRQGLGARLLQYVYDHYRRNGTVLDITVEDPSPGFTRLRDFVDFSNFMAEKALRDHTGPFTDEFAETVRTTLHLTKPQARRMYEIALLQRTNVHDPMAVRQFRLCVKLRLYQPFIKSKGSEARILHVMKDAEKALYLEEKKGVVAQIDADFKQLEEEYLHVIEQWRRLSA